MKIESRVQDIMIGSIMSAILNQIIRITQKIHNSSGCASLYSYFDELTNSLDSVPIENLTEEELSELDDLIDEFAYECTYNNFASANWMRYSARSFYCADYLIRYFPEKQQEAKISYLNLYFRDLLESGVAPIIQQEVFDKYFQINLTEENKRELYGKIVHKAMMECLKSRLPRAEEVTLARIYTESADRSIREYIARYNDYSPLKDWIPLLNTQRIANFWYEYPKSSNYSYSSYEEREIVIESMDAMLDVHLKLHSLWYWQNAADMIDSMSSGYLVDILEVYEDEEFEKILCHMASLPFNPKVKDILEHFANDDDYAVSSLSRQLLDNFLTR